MANAVEVIAWRFLQPQDIIDNHFPTGIVRSAEAANGFAVDGGRGACTPSHATISTLRPRPRYRQMRADEAGRSKIALDTGDLSSVVSNK